MAEGTRDPPPEPPAVSANPVVLSMLACDHIWRDPSTGKWDLLGVFEWLHSDVEPLKDVALEVYAQLTNLHGSYEFQLAVVRADDEKELARYSLGRAGERARPAAAAAARLLRHAAGAAGVREVRPAPAARRQGAARPRAVGPAGGRRTVRALRTRVISAGPDAVHLCLTVRGRPHVWGCAWASYGEARPFGPATRGSLRRMQRIRRARRMTGPAGPPPGPLEPP